MKQHPPARFIRQPMREYCFLDNRYEWPIRAALPFAPSDGHATHPAHGHCQLCVGSSGDLLPPSPPAEKSAARQDQAGKAGTNDGAGNIDGAKQPVRFAVDTIGEEEGVWASAIVVDASTSEAEKPK